MPEHPRLLFLLAVVSLAGCAFEGGFETGYRCVPGDTCPDGTACSAGFCVAGAPDAALHDAAVEPDGGDPPEARCGTLSLLHDELDDTTADPLFFAYNNPGSTVTEVGGQLLVQIGAGTGEPWAGYTSRYLYDLTDGQIATTVSAVGGTYTILEVLTDLGAKAQVFASLGELVASANDGTSEVELASIPYDPVAHRHWRIRESGGIMYWEVSADRTAWIELASEPLRFPVLHVRGLISAGGQLATASEARFDQVEASEAPALGFCSVDSAIDDFAATPLTPTWQSWSDGDCSVTETGGGVGLGFGGTGQAYCGIDSRHLYALGDQAMYLDVPNAAPTAGLVMFFQAVPLGEDETRVEIDRINGQLQFIQRVDGVNVDQTDLAYDAVAHRYWRIREAAGTLFWETAPDAVTWTIRATAPTRFDASVVHIVVGAGHDADTVSAPLQIAFSGINVP